MWLRRDGFLCRRLNFRVLNEAFYPLESPTSSRFPNQSTDKAVSKNLLALRLFEFLHNFVKAIFCAELGFLEFGLFKRFF